jgi:hypothetical protein
MSLLRKKIDDRKAIEQALEAEGGDITKAARRLHASRRTMQNRMREYGMPRGVAGRVKQPLPYKRNAARLAQALGAGLAVLVGGSYLLRAKRPMTPA